ncbi:hypothetical protein ACU5AX_09240 [Sphingomonas sp. XXL09]|uniref:hypothetical protein n=1 Tax=Sphingomonas sp. XXL09 TaxID=3457787 RepID=UPI00406BCFD0
MTKVRDALSIENTLFRVLGDLTIERAAEVTNKGKDYLRACTDPDKREVLSMRDAELLDLAYHEKNGGGFPLLEAYSRRLETKHAERFVDAAALGNLGAALAKEGGEAIAALVAIGLSNADPDKLRAALPELEQCDEIVDRAIAVCRDALDRAREGAHGAPI